MHDSLAAVILFIHEPKLITQTSNSKLLILTHLYHINSNEADLFIQQGETKMRALFIFKHSAAECGAVVHSWCASLHCSY